MVTHNLIVSNPVHNKVLLQEKNGYTYAWNMPNSSWYNFMFKNANIEVKIVGSTYGSPLLTFRDIKYHKLIFQEPLQKTNTVFTI